MLNQTLEQKLLQKLSPQQIQLMKLLQIPTVALEQRIKEEIIENPALELEEEHGESSNDEENFFDDEVNTDEVQNQKEYEDNFEISDYLDDDIPDYMLYSSNNSDTESKTIPYSSETSFRELLIEQLGFSDFNEKQKIIGEQIIGNINDSGYLERSISSIADDLSFYNNIKVTDNEVEDVLEIIQGFEPAGIGARNLKECLLIQLRRRETSVAQQLAIRVLEKCFDEFSKKHFSKILKKLSIDENDLKAVLDIILTLNPKPANTSSESLQNNIFIIPDFIINVDNGQLELIVNTKNIPELRISRTYSEMLAHYSKTTHKANEQQKQTALYVKQKIDSAKWFIDAIKQRNNTLYLTMHEIMNFQKKYFLSGEETDIKPMILKDIAESVNLDISTVSRVANSKYVQTPYGTFLLKTFFSEALSTDSGEEVSSREVKKILKEAILAEDKAKPLADELLTKMLINKGYNIARRTVAKYRESLEIPVARLRKQL